MQRLQRPRLKSLIEATSGSRLHVQEHLSLAGLSLSDFQDSTDESETEDDVGEDETDRTSSASTKPDEVLIVSCSSEPVETERLKNPFSYLFAAVIEDSILQMYILMQSNNLMKIANTLASMNVLKHTKYGVMKTNGEDDRQLINYTDCGEVKHKVKKLYNDLDFTMGVLKTVYTELKLHKSFKSLATRVEKTVVENNQLITVMKDKALNEARATKLSKQCKRQTIQQKAAIHTKDLISDDLQANIEDFKLTTSIREHYIGNWQVSRVEQHNLTIYSHVQQLNEKVDNYKLRYEYEQRIHLELESFTNVAIYDTLEKLDEMSKKFDIGMEETDLEIQVMKNAYLDVKEKRERLEEKFSKRDRIIKEWITFKHERVRAQEYRDKMNSYAITIQAWWRGKLVRFKLGPYKKKRKAKKKPIVIRVKY